MLYVTNINISKRNNQLYEKILTQTNATKKRKRKKKQENKEKKQTNKQMHNFRYQKRLKKKKKKKKHQQTYEVRLYKYENDANCWQIYQ